MKTALVIFLLSISTAFSFQVDKAKLSTRGRESLLTTSGTPRYSILNINNLTTWARYDGLSNFSPSSDNGLYYPRGTGNIVYKDGIVWGAKVFLDSAHTIPPSGQPIRVGGGTYGIGTRGGWVEGSGASAVPVPQNDPGVHVYRIRRDYRMLKYWDGSYTQNLKRDAGDLNEIPSTEVTDAQAEMVYQQYETDWQNWPADKGAPYIERNGVPGYQAPPAYSATFGPDSLIPDNYDEPGIAGADPDHPADQVLWMAYNDLNESTTLSFVSSKSIGLEIQKTIWAYRGSGPEGNMYFNRYRFINKGGVDTSGTGSMGSFFIDSMYICQWSDTDLGSFVDDLAGCDTTLQVGYTYNGKDPDEIFKRYGLPPPAFGYVLLQGPLVPSSGENGVFNLETRSGYRNLRMDSFAIWGSGDPYSDPPNVVPSGYAGTTGQWWKVVRGFAPIGSMSDPDVPYVAPPWGNPRFMKCGDPVASTGDLDGLGTSYSFVPGDRRFLLTTGPFSLSPGDTQEVIIGGVAGLGSDRLSSITVMKYNVKSARAFQHRLFSIPRPPPAPSPRIIELNRQLVLDWGSDTARTNAIERTSPGEEYAFEGYVIYQLPGPTSSLSSGKRIATFDVRDGVTRVFGETITAQGFVSPVLLQEGNDTGIQRFLNINADFLSDEYGRVLLNNGQKYYFAVTAYTYSSNPESVPTSMESPFTVITGQPRIPFGVVTSSKTGDLIPVTHLAGAGNGIVSAIVLDPLQSNGKTYQVRFDTTLGPLRWSLHDMSSGSVVLAEQPFDSSGTITEGGVVLTLIPGSSVFTSSDVFQYALSPVASGLDVEKASASRVGVFPNPYYAGRDQETTNWHHFVTFNNLPPRVTIRIFNLAGHLVRKLEKNHPSQFLEWDLANGDNWQVASGMYICYVEMPDIGETKILKLAVIQPQGVGR